MSTRASRQEETSGSVPGRGGQGAVVNGRWTLGGRGAGHQVHRESVQSPPVRRGEADRGTSGGASDKAKAQRSGLSSGRRADRLARSVRAVPARPGRVTITRSTVGDHDSPEPDRSSPPDLQSTPVVPPWIAPTPERRVGSSLVASPPIGRAIWWASPGQLRTQPATAISPMPSLEPAESRRGLRAPPGRAAGASRRATAEDGHGRPR